jgi:lambda family phage portal protein
MAGRLLSLASSREAMAREIASAPPPKARQHGGASRQRAMFAGARMDGIVDWAFSSIQSADKALQGDLSALRAHSRAHCANDPFASRFVNEVAINIVGPAGFRLQARVDTGDQAADLTTNRLIEEDWLTWAEDKDSVTADGKLDFWGLLANVATSEPGDGEILIRILPGFDNAYGFALQAIDPDQLDHTLNRPATHGRDGTVIQNAIRMGIEVNAWGRPLAYWIRPSHPTDTQNYSLRGNEPIRIPANLIIHDYLPVRVGQTRGIPWMSSVLRRGRLRDLYEEAAVVAARIGAAKVGFLQEEASAVSDPNDDDEGGRSAADFYMDPEPGSWEVLPAGIKPAEGWNPLYPAGEYAPFVKQTLLAEAAGLHISYMTLTGDLKETSFSSGRIGLFSERDTWRMGHKRKITNICRPVLRAWTPWARLTGKLRAAEGVFPADRPRVRWKGRGWANINPKDDINAGVAAADNLLGSRSQFLAEQGLDFDEVAEERARELATMERLGLTPRKVPSEAPADQDGEPDEDEDPSDGDENE